MVLPPHGLLSDLKFPREPFFVLSYSYIYYILIHVNFISSDISSTIKLFADDTKVYREIANSINDTRALQNDLDHLANWATLWHLRFNPEKCETMRITHNRDKSSPSYSTGVAIKPVKSVKDLEVLISYDLT